MNFMHRVTPLQDQLNDPKIAGRIIIGNTPSRDRSSENDRTRSPNSLNLRTTDTHVSLGLESREKKSQKEKMEFVERVQQQMARLTPLRNQNAHKSEAQYLNVTNSNFLQGIATFQPNSPNRAESEKKEESPNILLHWPFSPATILKRKELSVPRVNRGMLNDDLSPILNLISFHSPNLGLEARSEHQSDDCLTPRRLFDECYNGSMSPRASHGIYNRPFYPLSKSGNTEHTQLSPPHLEMYQSRTKNYTDFTRTSATNRQNRLSGYSGGQTTPFSLSDSQFQTKGDRIIRKRKRKTIEQLKMLQEEYEKNPTWSKVTMLEVAQKTGLSEAQVYKWGWDQKRKKLGADFVPEENGVNFGSQLNFMHDDEESSESEQELPSQPVSRLLKPRKAEELKAEVITLSKERKIEVQEGPKGRKSKRLMGEEASLESQEQIKRRKSTRSKAKPFKL